MADQTLENSFYDTKKVWLRALTSSLGYFSFGYTQGIFNSSQDCVSSLLNWGEDRNLYISITSSLLPLGCFLGAILTGILSKTFGKRKNLMITDIIMLIGSGVFMIPNTYAFGLARFISGIGIGCFSMLSAQYTNEFTPPDISGKMGSLNGFNGLFGQFISYSVCLLLPTKHCPQSIQFYVFLIFIVPGVVSLIQFSIFFKYFTLESPIWLVKIGENQLAKKCIKSIYSDHKYAELQVSLLIDQNKPPQVSHQNHELKLSEIVCCKNVTARSTRLGIIYHILQQLSGINAILYYSTLLFKDYGEFSRILTIMISGLRLITACLLLPIIDRYGRKPLTVISTFCMGACFFIITLLMGFSGLQVTLVIFIDLYLILFGVSLGPICWIYTSEILSDKAMALCTALNWGTCAVVVLIFPLVIDSYGLSSIFIVFGTVNILGAIYMHFDMIETKGMTKAQISDIFLRLR